MNDQNTCPKCASALGEIITTQTGKRLRRCSAGSWNPQTRKNEGCEYVLWLPFEPQILDESCPKCNSPLVLHITRFGKKMKKCSTAGWDSATKTATGCDYVEWINGTTVVLDEQCPECANALVLFTSSNGKKMKKCSTAGWDRVNRQATGCTYIYWLKPGEYKKEDTGEEFLPPIAEQ